MELELPSAADHAAVSRVIRSRRSVRHYLPDPVPDALLRELVELAMEAPSSFNLQSRSVVVVAGEQGRKALAAATGGQPHPQEAPVTLVFVAESGAWREGRDDIRAQARSNGAWPEQFTAALPGEVRAFYEDPRREGLEREFAVKDAMIAASFLMIAAHAAGLATSPMNGWDEAEVKEAIGISGRDDLHIAVLLPLGRPAESRLHPGRRGLALTLHRETYGR